MHSFRACVGLARVCFQAMCASPPCPVGRCDKAWRERDHMFGHFVSEDAIGSYMYCEARPSE